MNCYLCKYPDYRTRKGIVRDNPNLKVIECENCGLVTLDKLDNIQTGHYEDSGMHGKALPSIESWLKETDEDDQRRFEMLKASMVNQRILDFGSGAGGFLLKARLVAGEAVGIEPEQRIRKYYKDSAIQIYDHLNDAGKNYDLITAFHVFEHLADPRQMLIDLSACLAKKGRIIIEVPSAEDALLSLYENEAFQNFTYWSQHLFLFNSDTMKQLAVQAKLKVVSVQQYQRYPLSNHLYWLSKNLPGGHKKWSFLNTGAMNDAYSSALASVGKSDTIVAYLEKE